MKSFLRHSLYETTGAAHSTSQASKILTIALIFMAFLAPGLLQAQEKISVGGTVTDSTGVGIPQVTVTERGTKNATTTNSSGTFTLNVANPQSVLVFSSVGYAAREVTVGNQASISISLTQSNTNLGEVVVIGYGTRRRESITGAVSTVTANDIGRVHGGATVSSSLAGKIPGVTFRMPDGRPGASANIQIRNMGNPLYVIDGIQQDAGQFNNLAPNDIESITVLKDGSAAIYGARAANGVILVTTKRGRTGTPSINLDAFYGMQNWFRFPDVLNNSYDYMRYRAEAEMNRSIYTGGMTPTQLEEYRTRTQGELEKYRAGTEYGYQSFDWKKFIIQPNAPLASVNLNITGGNEAVKYYISGTKLHQNSVLGREYKFDRTNIQSNLDARITKRLRAGVQINGRIETRQNPGVPGFDDYWLPRFAILRNRPFERPYANDNPEYLNKIEQGDANWAYNTYKHAGKLTDEWRVLQTNAEAEYQIPGIEGLSVKGMYSYYIADNLLNNQEYTYKTYTYDPNTQQYNHTGGSTNPWRERNQIKQINQTSQLQLNYNKTFGDHTIGALLVNERISQQRRRNWIRSNPQSNALPLIYYSTLRGYQDEEDREARVGYIARINYSFANKYFLEAFGRRDASQVFRPDSRVGYFPGASAGWRVSREAFASRLFQGVLSDLKLRAAYGKLGDDRNTSQGGVLPFGNFAYVPGYSYGNNGVAIIAGQPVTVSRDRGIPITDFSWLTSVNTNVGADFALFNGKLTGTFDWFRRTREGLPAPRYDLLLPREIGYELPVENLESDAIVGQEGSLNYSSKVRGITFTVGANLTYARSKWVETYKEVFFNSWDKYRSGRLDRYRNIDWGYEVEGQFQSQEEINNHPVNIDGQGNRTLLPGDLKYKTSMAMAKSMVMMNVLSALDMVNSLISMAVLISHLPGTVLILLPTSRPVQGTLGFQNWETRWPFQNGGNFNTIFEDRWHRQDLFDVNSAWTPGKYPALRFNEGGHSNYIMNNNRNSTFWLHNVKYLRARTIQLGYTVPASILGRVNIKRARGLCKRFQPVLH
jgi:TonB-linked SusC/RagA family outer membrane protein